MTSEQMKAARALLRMDQKKLAELSGVSLPTIKRLETKHGPLRATQKTAEKIQAALESRGIVFTLTGGVTFRA